MKMSPSVLLPSLRVGIAVIDTLRFLRVTHQRVSREQACRFLDVLLVLIPCVRTTDSACRYRRCSAAEIPDPYTNIAQINKVLKKGGNKGEKSAVCFQVLAHLSQNAAAALWLLFVNGSSAFFHFSCFFAWCICVSSFLRSFPFVFSFFSSSRNSLISSSHLFLCLQTGLFVLMLVSSPGFHSATFLDHRSSVNDAILIASLHFIFLCVSIQQVIFAFFICSSTSFVPLFM